ncbi:MAG: RsmB/NOP family class I SAM-dependent RNA methyltransferase, partial [Bacteroidia bacterium]|nr:RsmB/NOP family class I SAM-dependent RNA methyltransferase [Bacteroidia bacterium]
MSSIPEEFLNSLNNTPGFSRTKFVESHKEGKVPVSIRINPLKNAHVPFSVSGKVKWANEAYYLTERPVFTADPLFHAGCYYVQEASSMFIEFILKQTIDFGKEIKALDLCGAPGGKSTLINSLLTDESLLVANETVKGRSDILVQNLVKWGRHNFVVTNSEPKAFSEIPNYFDLIVVDAPCSGSGLFRKTPEAIKEWSLEHVESCSLRQQKILSDVLPSLKSGGVLVYSTCSFS